MTIWQIQKLFILLWVRKDCRVTENLNTKYFTDMLHCLKNEVSQWKLKIVLWNLRSSKIVLLLELCTVVNPFFFCEDLFLVCVQIYKKQLMLSLSLSFAHSFYPQIPQRSPTLSLQRPLFSGGCGYGRSLVSFPCLFWQLVSISQEITLLSPSQIIHKENSYLEM